MTLAAQAALVFEFHGQSQFGRHGLEQRSWQRCLSFAPPREQHAAKLSVHLHRDPEHVPHFDQRTDHRVIGRLAKFQLHSFQTDEQLRRQGRLWRQPGPLRGCRISLSFRDDPPEAADFGGLDPGTSPVRQAAGQHCRNGIFQQVVARLALHGTAGHRDGFPALFVRLPQDPHTFTSIR